MTQDAQRVEAPCSRDGSPSPLTAEPLGLEPLHDLRPTNALAAARFAPDRGLLGCQIAGAGTGLLVNGPHLGLALSHSAGLALDGDGPFILIPLTDEVHSGGEGRTLQESCREELR